MTRLSVAQPIDRRAGRHRDRRRPAAWAGPPPTCWPTRAPAWPCSTATPDGAARGGRRDHRRRRPGRGLGASTSPTADMVAAVIGAVRDDLGPVDILVNNAGVSLPAGHRRRRLRRRLGHHAGRQPHRPHDADPGLPRRPRRDGAGRIVNIASTEGLGATAFLSAYTASKHGVVGLTRVAGRRARPDGASPSTASAPGPIHTGMTAAIPDEAKERFARRRVPLRRYGEPEEVAHATLSLVLPAAVVHHRRGARRRRRPHRPEHLTARPSRPDDLTPGGP